MPPHPNRAAQSRALQIIARCRELARVTDVPGETTRLFLSPATRDAHTLLSGWMHQAARTCPLGEVRVDDSGSLRLTRRAVDHGAPTLLLFSHIDTVPDAGAFDGPLGVVLALAVLEELGTTPLPFAIELIAFSEEEGVRFGFPFLSSLAATGALTPELLARTDSAGHTVSQALAGFGLDPTRIPFTCALPPDTFAALEVHIEQGPVLDAERLPLAVVESIIGQSRLRLSFEGQANHAGTTPMPLRRDALAAAAAFIAEVEPYALRYNQLLATVGRIEAHPGATNIVPGTVHLSLDVRHPRDESRHAAVAHLLTRAEAAGSLRGVRVRAVAEAEQRAVPLDRELALELHAAAEHAGCPAKSMFSGAGHDSMILTPHVPTAMLFVRSPGGLSHHPDETVREEDVAAALETVLTFLRGLDPHRFAPTSVAAHHPPLTT